MDRQEGEYVGVRENLKSLRGTVRRKYPIETVRTAPDTLGGNTR